MSRAAGVWSSPSGVLERYGAEMLTNSQCQRRGRVHRRCHRAVCRDVRRGHLDQLGGCCVLRAACCVLRVRCCALGTGHLIWRRSGDINDRMMIATLVLTPAYRNTSTSTSSPRHLALPTQSRPIQAIGTSRFARRTSITSHCALCTYEYFSHCHSSQSWFASSFITSSRSPWRYSSSTRI